MVEPQEETKFKDSLLLRQRDDTVSPEQRLLREFQAINSLYCGSNLANSSLNDHIEVKSDSYPPQRAHAAWSQDLLPTSSQLGHIRTEQQTGTTSGNPVGVTSSGGFSMSSCDEDAEGEPDESFYSGHSFWTSPSGDTSLNTTATFDVEEPSFPLLGRDGIWKGKAQQGAEAHNGSQHELEHGQEHHQQPPPLVRWPEQLSNLTPFYSASPALTLQEQDAHAASSESNGVPFSSRKKRKGVNNNSSPESEDKNRILAKPKRTSKKASIPLKKSNEAARNIRQSPDKRRRNSHASGEVNGRASRGSASPSTSTSGRYGLRKRDTGPKRSVIRLSTPPSDDLARSLDEDVYRSANRFNEDDSGTVVQVPANWTASPVVAETLQVAAGQQADRSAELDIVQPAPQLRPTNVREKGRRAFPVHWETHPGFPLLYQRYCVPSSVSPEVLEILLRGLNPAKVDDEFREIVERAQSVYGTFNKPRSILDLYTPRFVKGVGAQKVGMCPVCYEDGKVEFLKTKFSAYNYHLQNFHGISALTCLPFAPPTKFRTKVRPNAKPKERNQLVQGLCHSCNKYINMQGPKDTEVKVAEIYWWKHAQVCHRNARVPEGMGGYFVENYWWERICGILEMVGGFEAEVRKLLAANK